jgi:hypothetical protein
VVSFIRAATGTAAVLAAFIFGVWFGISQRPLLRYEMDVDSSHGNVVRLDKVTGTIHVVTSAGIVDLLDPFEIGCRFAQNATAMVHRKGGKIRSAE